MSSTDLEKTAQALVADESISTRLPTVTRRLNDRLPESDVSFERTTELLRV
jgi:hypothetical protein